MMRARTVAATLAALGIAVPAAAFNPEQTARAARELSTPFTIAVLPDTQAYSEDPALTVAFEKQVEWVLAQREALNIAFVTHLGDVVDNGTDLAQWERAMGALRPLLEQHELPFSIVRGNHDDPATFLQNLPPDTRPARKWTVGASPSGLARAQIFKVEALRFLHLGLQVDPTPADLAWADALLASADYAYLPVIVSTHDDLGLGGRTAVGRGLWESFVSVHPMIFMVLNGHVHGEASRVSHDTAGRPVYQMLSDYQSREFGGNGLMRLVTVDPVAGEIQVRTFSPWWRTTAPDGTAIYEPGHFETDWNSEFAFSLNVRERLAWDTTWDFGPEPLPPPPPPLDPIPSTIAFTHVFQDRRPLAGASDSYQGTVDTQMNENNPTLNYAGEVTVSTDLDDAGSRVQSLLRFDGLVGDAPGQLPPGATITSAKLLFHVTSGTKGNVSLHRMLLPWTERSVWMDFTPVDASGQPTWTSFTFVDGATGLPVTLPHVMVGGGVDADGVEALADADATFSCKKPIPTPFVVDVTSSVQAWVDGAANLGWAMLSDSTDGFDFSTADGEQPPALVVDVAH